MFIIGILLALLYIKINFGNSEGTNPKIFKPNIGLFIRNGHVYICNKHIHHWIIYSILLLIFNLINKYIISLSYLNLYNGFFITMIIHGLSYSDWNRF